MDYVLVASRVISGSFGTHAVFFQNRRWFFYSYISFQLFPMSLDMLKDHFCSVPRLEKHIIIARGKEIERNVKKYDPLLKKKQLKEEFDRISNNAGHGEQTMVSMVSTCQMGRRGRKSTAYILMLKDMG